MKTRSQPKMAENIISLSMAAIFGAGVMRKRRNGVKIGIGGAGVTQMK
jgi:hypothetical protein